MGYLGDKCKNLKTIDISGCIMLTDESILQLTKVSYRILPEALIRALFYSKDSFYLQVNENEVHRHSATIHFSRVAVFK